MAIKVLHRRNAESKMKGKVKEDGKDVDLKELFGSRVNGTTILRRGFGKTTANH